MSRKSSQFPDFRPEYAIHPGGKVTVTFVLFGKPTFVAELANGRATLSFPFQPERSIPAKYRDHAAAYANAFAALLARRAA